MARVSGYACDHCSRLVTQEQNQGLPEGWMILMIPTNFDGNQGENRFEFCSNKCLRDFAAVRHKADRELGVQKGPRRPYGPRISSDDSDTEAEQKRFNYHIRYHVRKDTIAEDCKFCEELTRQDASL